MHDRILAVEALRRGAANQLLVEGWVEGPIAEAADLRGINQLMLDFGDEPAFVADLMTWCVELACSFASAQLAAGADIIGIGDAAASLVGPAIYEEFVWPAERRLIEHVHRHGGRTRLHICGNTTPLLSLIGRLGSDTVDIDYLTSLQSARNAMPGQVLAGNLDPVRVLRNGTPQRVTDAVARCHGDAGSRFIVAAGCEVPRDTEPANLAALVGYARCRPDGLALEGGVRA
jgi:MtaA/CmuA family methyltransferase